MITMDMAGERLDRPQQAALPAADGEALWAEHGWGLKAWQVGGILALIGAASAVMHLAG